MWVKQTVTAYADKKVKFDIASNPEFLREGQAISDFMHPDRVILGVESKKAADLLTGLYKPLKAPILVTDVKSAELIKHASNSFLATKISFINAVSQVCDKVGADVSKVALGMGLDKRIGTDFLNAGLGYGGSCFPKDVDAFIAISEKLGYEFELLSVVRHINSQQKAFFMEKIKEALWIIKGKTIAALGVSFKPNTDDIRSSAAVEIIRALHKEGAKIRVYDPKAMNKAKSVLKGVTFCSDAYSASQGSDCLLVLTEWDEFKELDFSKIKKLLKRPVILDGRNIYDPREMRNRGFTYESIGRKSKE